MEEYKIGETFNIGRKKFQVVKGGSCEGCYFFENDFDGFCCDLQDYYVGSCNHMQREDAQDVCYKLVEE